MISECVLAETASRHLFPLVLALVPLSFVVSDYSVVLPLAVSSASPLVALKRPSFRRKRTTLLTTRTFSLAFKLILAASALSRGLLILLISAYKYLLVREQVEEM